MRPSGTADTVATTLTTRPQRIYFSSDRRPRERIYSSSDRRLAELHRPHNYRQRRPSSAPARLARSTQRSSAGSPVSAHRSQPSAAGVSRHLSDTNTTLFRAINPIVLEFADIFRIHEYDPFQGHQSNRVIVVVSKCIDIPQCISSNSS
jgi:hypothetical protein